MNGMTLNSRDGNDPRSHLWAFRALLWGSAIALSTGTAALAEPLASLELGDMPLRNQELTAGPTRVVIIEFDPLNYEVDETQYLTYAVYVNDEFQTQVRQEVDFRFADFSLQNLDPDEVPEVVFHRYTGGAHCCSIFTTYSLQGDRLHRSLTYPLDAAGAGGFQDIDGDGYSEFLSADQRFLYAFGSYASSWPPTIFLTFRNGSLIDTTRQFSDRLRSTAYNMYEHTRDNPGLGANSILAGYVGQKVLMDEYESGWDYMLAHYDETDTWGLTEYSTDGEEIGAFADYPEALESFLIDLEYLTVNGDPNPNLDLSRVVVEQESLL